MSAIAALTLLSTGLAQGDLPEVSAKVVSASLFKNGYAVVVREALVPTTGQGIIPAPPQSVLGTFWISSSPGVQIRELIATTLTKESDRDVQSLDEALTANVGKVVGIKVREHFEGTAKILSAAGSIVILEPTERTQQRGVLILPKGSVLEISGAAGEVVWKVKQKTNQQALRFTASAPRGGVIKIVSLEPGISWAPAYALDISDEKTLRLVARASLINDSLDLDGVDVRLVTGFPNVPFLNIQDPFTSFQNLQMFVSALMRAGAPEDAAQSGMAYQMARNRLSEKLDFAEAFPISQATGEQNEDLFFYPLSKVTLKRGDRGYHVLFTAESEYAHVYTCSLGDSIVDDQYVERPEGPRDVWHSLKFKNTSGKPFTTASAITMKDSSLLGQDMMHYTSANAEATVKITKALDVAVEDAEEEIERQRDALRTRSRTYDKVTIKGRIRVINRKAQAVSLELSKGVSGEILATDRNPKVTVLAKGLRAVNPRNRIEWKLDLSSGESAEITYQYSVYIAT